MMAAKTEAPQGKAGFLVLKECLSSLPTETATDGDDSREGQQGREQTAGRGQGQTAAAEWRVTEGGRGLDRAQGGQGEAAAPWPGASRRCGASCTEDSIGVVTAIRDLSD